MKVETVPVPETGIRFYNQDYTKKLLLSRAEELGFPVALQYGQWERLVAALYETGCCLSKAYDEETMRRMHEAWVAGQAFHLTPRYPAPDPVSVPQETNAPAA